MSFNPNLAAEAELNGTLPYPLAGLFKLNGVRSNVQQAQVFSRNLELIPNKFVQQCYASAQLERVEGELVVGNYSDPNVFVNTTSGVMSIEGEPPVTLWAFDYYHPTETFVERHARLGSMAAEHNKFAEKHGLGKIIVVEYKILHNDAEAREYLQIALDSLYEGLVLRKPNGLYKQGRSTENEAGFMRLVPWLRSECKILEIQEGKTNQNKLERSNTGAAKRSSKKEGMVASGLGGSFVVEDLVTKKKFKITIAGDDLKADVMKHPEKYLGKIWRYHYKAPVKLGGLPRFPQMDGPRDRRDM